MPETELIEQAQITKVVDGEAVDSTKLTVHFNPESLEFTVSNTLEEKGRGSNKKQFVAQSTAKLTMDLDFDTTLDGSDVRIATGRIAAFMRPDESKTPAIVRFEWGAYKFDGMIESYKETIDFFSSSGIPLRSKVALTLAGQDAVFDVGTASQSADTSANGTPQPISAPSADGRGVTETATRAGNPGAGRALAAQNNAESMRFPASTTLDVSASVELGPPIAFSTGSSGGGGSLGAGLSLGLDAGGGVELGASGDLELALQAGGSASLAPFAALRSSTPSSGASRLSPDRLLQTTGAGGLATDASAAIELGGRATIGGGASIGADVGAQASLRDLIRFDEE